MDTAKQEDAETRRMLALEKSIEGAKGRYLQRLRNEMKNLICRIKVSRESTSFKLAQVGLTDKSEVVE